VNSNWWDELGEPQYGGEMTIRASRNIENFDPYYSEGMTSIYGGWLERLVSDDWTLDPKVWDYKLPWHPSKYMKGQLAENWEFTEPGTHVVHLRKGIHWQNIPPANGREFTADDVVFHYNRLYGLGGGFSKDSPFCAEIGFRDILSVNAVDKYTVVFKFNIPNPEFIMETLHGVMQRQCLENHEAVKQWGDLSDWHHAVGTGPFILEDFVPGSSVTLIKNPAYWGHDERHPQNQLPYVDKLNFLIIPDESAALEAMRAGKIDAIDMVSYSQAQAMKLTNPEILQIKTPSPNTPSIDPRNDKPPFNDIRVRTAMQMALDLPAIAQKHYGGNAVSNPSTLTSKDIKGWGLPYAEWPQDIKDEYRYNPDAARKLLKDAGYPGGFKTNIVVESTINMGLLELVKSYFAAVGIDMEIRSMETAAFVNYVMINHKNDQLVQRSASSLGLATEPIRQLERLRTGAVANYMMVSDPIFDGFLPRAMAAGNIPEIKKVLCDANEYVARQHFAVSLVQPMQYSLYQPWLKGYDGQFFALSAASGGPPMVFFYPARFWIDRQLKQSMGHKV
jgi:peptide/nickel transport system substrate-binding protein